MNKQSSKDFLNELITNLKKLRLLSKHCKLPHKNELLFTRYGDDLGLSIYHYTSCVVITAGFSDEFLSGLSGLEKFLIFAMSENKFSEYYPPREQRKIGEKYSALRLGLIIKPISVKYCKIDCKTTRYLSNKRVATIVKKYIDTMLYI